MLVHNDGSGAWHIAVLAEHVPLRRQRKSMSTATFPVGHRSADRMRGKLQESVCTYLQAILSVCQLNMQLSEDIALIASVLNLHARPPGVPPFRGFDFHIAPHASSSLGINRVQISVLLQKKQHLQAHGVVIVSTQVSLCKKACAQTRHMIAMLIQENSGSKPMTWRNMCDDVQQARSGRV